MVRILNVIALFVTVVACALAVPSGRVVGGTDAEDGQFKYQISLQHFNGVHTCGVVNENYGNFVHDLALLELEEPLEFCDKIQPIELATEEVPSGGDIIVSGWGRLYNNGPIPNHLQWTTLKAMTTEECRPYFADLEPNIDALICLAHGSNHGVCNGDSGGPATYKGKLVGVASFVMDGCGSTNPDGYAKVSHHYDWIIKNMEK
uniref:Peptidase S1 domain-containing protein n=1 Tax=Glossina morsitans morsitans TaxID=37546 RepID=A0A1B0G8X1_GLOMM